MPPGPRQPVAAPVSEPGYAFRRDREVGADCGVYGHLWGVLMRARWFAVLILGFVAGAATIILADSGPDETRVTVPVASGVPAPGATAINGQHIHGVKAGDVAAEAKPDKPLDRATRDVLQAQLMVARDVALRYPTVADATAAGYFLAGGFAPGSGAHYVGIGGIAFGNSQIDVAHPSTLIYDGTSPDSRIVGLMYLGYGGKKAPAGFAGPNDHWHRHSGVCIKYGGGQIEVPFPADADVTRKQCADVGGSFLNITPWMVHAWVVPSWESPLGVFSHDNPNVRCADGTYTTDKAGFCKGT